MEHVSVIGSGTMGNGITHLFAQHGFKVTMVNLQQVALDNALAIISKNLDRQVKKGIITVENKEEIFSNISCTTDLPAGVSNAELVVEAVTEDPELKSTIFKQLDQYAPSECILASNTSSISITAIASATKRPEYVIGMHFMNPVPVMKLVEVIRGYATSTAVTKEVMELAKSVNKTPVEVNDYPGFISNRILMPMINEAIYALHEGVAGADEIDTVMKLGMAHPMGPLKLADFIGLDVCLSILQVLQKGFGLPKYAPCPLLVNMVTAGHLGVKSGQGFYSWPHGT